ncbi:HAT family dimerization protein [Mycena venus]|uniref:HAT family dimerization protein n=1 Tax=Mycena venus TaxID=2733690 RepID=A0A8H7CM87_9AGAR|nr:HAT family dimerization protein [Mycena venus]
MASKPKKKSGVEDWRWGAFWKGKLYQNDKHHKEARCRGEVALEEARLKEEQAEKIRRGAIQPRDALPGDKLHELAKNAVKPLCGKMKYLSKHIRECDSVDIKWKQKLEAAERDESGSDNDTTSATATTSQAVVKSNKRQATFELVAGAKRFRKDHQEDFETDILKLWTSLNASFNSVEHPFWVPGAHTPGRDALSGRILDSEVLSIEAGRTSEMKGELATASVDGWSTKHDAVQQVSCNVKGKEIPIKLHITTKERKTSVNLLTHVMADIVYLTTVLCVTLVAFCCDSGGDSRGLRPLLLNLMPWILTIPCWAHQINLVVKEYIGCSDVTAILANCLKIINWFSSHKRALLMLLEEQQAINEKRPPGQKWERLKRFVRAGITRWGTHALSVRRLAELQGALLDLINHRGEDLESAGGDDEEAREKAAEVIALIDSGKMGPFWTGVHRLSRYLTPLAVASNVTQGANTRLDHVLITLAILHYRYSTDNKTFDCAAHNAVICTSLAKRWKALKHDQDFYILAVFFNPFLRAFFFNDEIHSLSRIGLYHVVKRVYARIFKIDEDSAVPSVLFEQYLDYYDGTGRYTSEKMALNEFKHMFKNEDTVVLMNSIWRGVKGELALMAKHILAMIANSGGNERAFSVLGRTYSDKTRNLLNPERAHKSLIVQRHILETFPSSKQRKRRHVPFIQLRADVKSGADNLIPDDEDEPANGNVAELTHCLNELPDDGDAGEDDSPEPEIAQAIRRPAIRLHFGTEELYELNKIFTEASINTVSTWGGSLLSYQVDGTPDLNNIMADFEEDGPGHRGSDEIIIDDE